MKFRFNTKRTKKTVDFGNLLPDIISEFEMSESFILQDIESKWQIIVGNILSAHSIPDRIFKKVLFIRADHSVYANEIMMMNNEIIENICSNNPAASITSIKVEIKKF